MIKDEMVGWHQPTRWTWVWVNSGSWWWTERPGMLQSTESQIVGHDWVTEHKTNQISFGNSKNWKEESINTYQHRDNHQSQATEFLHKWFADRTAEIHYMLHQTIAESKCLHKITKTAIVGFTDSWLKQILRMINLSFHFFSKNTFSFFRNCSEKF